MWREPGRNNGQRRGSLLADLRTFLHVLRSHPSDGRCELLAERSRLAVLPLAPPAVVLLGVDERLLPPVEPLVTLLGIEAEPTPREPLGRLGGRGLAVGDLDPVLASPRTLVARARGADVTWPVSTVEGNK